MQNAPLFLRFVASTVDSVATATLLAVSIGSAVFAPIGFGAGQDGAVALVVALVTGAAAVWYACFRDGNEDGQGIGKRLCGTQLVDADSGRPPGLARALARNLIQSLFNVTIILGLVDLILCLADAQQRRLVDRIVGTRVVVRGESKTEGVSPKDVRDDRPSPHHSPHPPMVPPPITIPITSAYLEGLGGAVAGTIFRLPVQVGGAVDCVIGRGSDDPAILDMRSTMVSRKQARILRHEGFWFVQHLSATNPTILNGQDVGAVGTFAQIADGSELLVGDVRLRFRC